MSGPTDLGELPGLIAAHEVLTDEMSAVVDKAKRPGADPLLVAVSAREFEALSRVAKRLHELAKASMVQTEGMIGSA